MNVNGRPVSITATELARWADGYHAGFELPDLVRRLIVEAPKVRRLHMPAGDSARRGGWDGQVEAERGDAWVPAGVSAWEMGAVRADGIATKANDDYTKRTADPLGVDPATATYVCVTARPWSGKDAWETARKGEGVWRDIRVLDGDDLATWLTAVPRVARWFAAEHLKRADVLTDWVWPTIDWDDEALRPDTSPLSWLTWQARLTDLVGRDGEKAELLRWARDSGGGVRFRFLVGEGGTGKTRLAHEVADELARDPAWAAGRVSAEEPLPLDLGQDGCLLLIDYPEEKREDVRKRLEQIATTRPDPARAVRVLFLTRNGPDYWEPVVNEAGAGRQMTSLVKLPDGMTPDAAWAMFRTALAKVPGGSATVAPAGGDRAAFDDWLARVAINQRPLLIAAAAIQAALEPQRAVFALGARQVIDALAEREALRLRRLAMEHGFGARALERLAALAAVRGGLDAGTLRRLSDPALDLGLGARTGLVDRLDQVGVLKGGRLPAPEPDIVAASLVVKALAHSAIDAAECLWAAVDGAEGEALARLARLSYDAEVVLGHHQHRLSHWLKDMADGCGDRCAKLDGLLRGNELPIGLNALAAAVSMTLAGAATDDEERARHLHTGSIRLGGLGDVAGALVAIREAVEIRRRLSASNPARFEPDLAGSLNNLSVDLSDAGDGAGALAAIREAVEIRRRLSASTPARFEPDLATSLNNLSVRLSDAGDGAGALAAIREAVEVYRRLSACTPARFEPDLAMSLNNLSGRLSAAGDGAGALAAIREAVEIRRRLSASNPARFEPDLANSLHNLSNRLSDAGDGAGALAAIREAVEVYRRLSASTPARFEPNLAGSLNNLSLRLSEAGDGAGALAAIREAVEVYRRLSASTPARFEPDLAMSLNNLSLRLSDAGDGAGALAAIREAVEVYRRLSASNPARFAHVLGYALDVLSDRLDEGGDRAGALAALAEALALVEPMARAYPTALPGQRYRLMEAQMQRWRAG
jgi:hypothetical protein